MTVTAEFPVSVTNEEQTIEWKEQGLILHVPKDSLPPGCSTQVTMFIAEPNSNQAQDMYSQYIFFGLKCINGEKPKGLTLKTCCGADTPQSQGEW